MIALCTFTQICLGVTNTCSTFFRADLVVAIGAGMAGNADTFVILVTSSIGPRTMIWTLQRKINVFLNAELSSKCMKVQLLSIVLPIVYHNSTHAFLGQLFPPFFAKTLFNSGLLPLGKNSLENQDYVLR